MNDQTVGVIMIVAAAAVVMAGICYLTWLDHKRQPAAVHPTEPDHASRITQRMHVTGVTIDSDAPLTPEDMQAIHVALHHIVDKDTDALYQAIVAQVAEDSAVDELDAVLDEIRGEAS